MSAWWAMPGPGDIPALGERCDYDGGVAEDDAILIADESLESIEIIVDRVRALLIRRDCASACTALSEAQDECVKAIKAIRRFC